MQQYIKHVCTVFEVVVNSNEQDSQRAIQLAQLLKVNYATVRGTCLTYTATPDSLVTEFLIQAATFVAEVQHVDAGDILMPDMGFPGEDLHRILNTYIESEDKAILYPVNLLLEKNHYITTDELQRLGNHSALTRNYVLAKIAYADIAKSELTLWGQLDYLCDHLYLNSVNARGSESNAASSVYDVINQFMNYYTTLSKASIPEDVQKQINALVDVYSQQERCISLRRDELLTSMANNEAVLREIKPDAVIVSYEKVRIEQNLKSTKDALESAFLENKYSGRDSLGFSTPLLETLGLVCSIETPEDLALFHTLTIPEIMNVLQSPDLRQQVVTQLESFENLAKFVATMPVYKLQSWLVGMQAELKNRFIKNLADLSALLIELDVDKCGIVCKACAETIQSSWDFLKVLQVLKPEQRTAVYESLKDQLSDRVKVVKDLSNIMYYLTPDQRIAVYDVLKANLPKMVKSAYDFKLLLRSLTPDQYTEVCESLLADNNIAESLLADNNIVGSYRNTLKGLVDKSSLPSRFKI
jgi:hypothetical protein